MPKLIKVSSFCPSAPTAMLLVGSFVASLLLLAASPAHAQSTISAIPPRLEVTLNPGETKEFELKVRNESETTRLTPSASKTLLSLTTSAPPYP